MSEYADTTPGAVATKRRGWLYRACEAIARWIGQVIANVFFGRVPGGRGR